MKIKSIKKIEYSGDVYNLRIKTDSETNHNYYANDICVSNCHKSKAVSIKNILEHCWDAEYRFGVSGTMPKNSSADYLTLQTYLGPVVTEVKAKTLQDDGYISNCSIFQLRMDYVTEKKKQELSEAYTFLISQGKGTDAFTLEKNFIIENEKRFKFINELIEKTTKNTLVLFHRIIYGKKLYKHLKENLPDKRVYYIDGSIDKNTRMEITNRMDKYDDVILVASYATLSTGISINKIFNIFFTESFKSPYIILQSIGRGLRLKDKENKENNHVTIIDLVDDFRIYKYINYLYKHGVERMRLYKEQNYPVKTKKIKF